MYNCLSHSFKFERWIYGLRKRGRRVGFRETTHSQNRILGYGFWVPPQLSCLGLGFRVSGLGYRILGPASTFVFGSRLKRPTVNELVGEWGVQVQQPVSISV